MLNVYKNLIENDKDYNEELRVEIELKLKDIVKKKEINIDCIM